MSDEKNLGMVVWQDLTVKDVETVRDFYSKVVGWQFNNHDMGGYHDHDVLDSEGNIVAGICHARGSNASVPPQWLLYVTVASVEKAADACLSNGGEILDGPRLMGKQPFCIIKDPAGAVLALIEA